MPVSILSWVSSTRGCAITAFPRCAAWLHAKRGGRNDRARICRVNGGYDRLNPSGRNSSNSVIVQKMRIVQQTRGDVVDELVEWVRVSALTLARDSVPGKLCAGRYPVVSGETGDLDYRHSLPVDRLGDVPRHAESTKSGLPSGWWVV